MKRRSPARLVDCANHFVIPRYLLLLLLPFSPPPPPSSPPPTPPPVPRDFGRKELDGNDEGVDDEKKLPQTIANNYISHPPLAPPPSLLPSLSPPPFPSSPPSPSSSPSLLALCSGVVLTCVSLSFLRPAFASSGFPSPCFIFIFY